MPDARVERAAVSAWQFARSERPSLRCLMSDHEGLPGPIERPAASVPQPPRRVACPRCRGTFEGNPDVCPHCGFAKADIPTLSARAAAAPAAVSGPAVAPPAAPPSTAPSPAPTEGAPPPVAPAVAPIVAPAAAPADVPAAPEAADAEARPRKKPRLLWLAVAAVLLVAAGVGWWVTTTGGVEEDPCAKFRQELQQVQARDYPNSREERRAVAEVTGKAHDAGCDPSDLTAEADSR